MSLTSSGCTRIKMAKFHETETWLPQKRLTEQVEKYAIKTSLSVDAGLEMAGSAFSPWR